MNTRFHASLLRLLYTCPRHLTASFLARRIPQLPHSSHIVKLPAGVLNSTGLCPNECSLCAARWSAMPLHAWYFLLSGRFTPFVRCLQIRQLQCVSLLIHWWRSSGLTRLWFLTLSKCACDLSYDLSGRGHKGMSSPMTANVTLAVLMS